jgi:hypothetical protein
LLDEARLRSDGRATKQETGMTRTAAHHTAAAAFHDAKADIDRLLARITSFSQTGFGLDGEPLDWGHVGDARRTRQQLQEVADALFREGEFAS